MPAQIQSSRILSRKTKTHTKSSLRAQTPKILLVEDDPELLNFLAEFFQFKGYRCRIALEGAGALKVLQREDINLLITDLDMPGMSGIELIQAVNAWQPDLPKIIISGKGRFEDAVQAIGESVYYYFTKPIKDFDEVERVVRRAVAQGRLLREHRELQAKLAEAENQLKAAQAADEAEKAQLIQHYKTLLENGHDGILILDADSRIIDVNQNAAYMFGLLRREMTTGMRLTDIRAPHLSDFLKRLNDSLENGGETTFEAELPRPDGSHLDVDVTQVIVLSVEPYKTIFYIRDFSENKRHQKITKQRLEKLEEALANRLKESNPEVGTLLSLMNSANAIIVLIDRSGNALEWNTAADNITGYSRREAIQPSALKSIIVNYEKLFLPLIEHEVFESGRELESLETEVRTAAGEIRHIRWNVAPLREAGRINAALAIGVNVTTERELRKAMEVYAHQLEAIASERTRELLQSQERFRHLFDHVRDAIFAAAEDGGLLEVNPAWQKLLGFPVRIDVLGKHFLKDFAVHPHEAERLLQTLQARNLLQDEIIQLKKRDGSQVTALLTISAQPGLNSDMPCYEGVIRDITQIRELEQKIIAHSRDLERLVEERSQQLAQSEAKLRRLTENSPDAIYRIDVQTLRFDYLSPAAEAISGYTIDQIKGMGPDGYIACLHPDDAATVIELWSSLNRMERFAGNRYTLEYRFIRAGGEAVWLADHGTVIRDESGNIMALEGVIRDITIQKRAAEQLSRQADLLEQEVARRAAALFESESRYRMLLSEAGDIIFTCRENGDIVEMNRRGEDLLGKTVEDLNQSRWINSLDEHSRRRFKKALRTCFQNGVKPEPFQIEPDTPHGEKLYLEIQSSPVVIEGKVALTLNVARDLTARRRAAQAIRALKEFNEGIIRSMSEGILIEDDTGKCEFVNPAFAEMLGYKSAELIGRYSIDLTPASERDYILNQTELCRLRGSNRCEAKLLSSDGEEVPVLISSRTRYDGDRIVGALSVITDLRQMKEMERRQRYMENLLADERKLADIGMLAAGIAHNISSPLMVISGYAQMLNSRFPNVKEIDTILTQIDKIEQITRNMMIKSRSEQDKNVRVIDINELLKTELKFLEANLFFKSKVEKEYVFGDDIPPFEGVYSDFSQTFSNIVNNAIDAMHNSPARHLRVQTKRCGKEIHIEIEDNGCGIAEADISRIFDPFFTTKPTVGDIQDGGPTGTGLGLSTAQQMIQHYGGRIEVESKVGQGSLFRIALPIPRETSDQSAKPDAPRTPALIQNGVENNRRKQKV
ncbi:MAG: PAS domain S-box protein [Calditrichaeota bacterium]|nr:PAS domain S-box protein [Calditrichota bacterium]